MSSSKWNKLAIARKLVRDRMPYLESIMHTLAPIEAQGLGTIGVTENGILVVDLDWFNTLSNENAAAALVHETMHVLRLSAARTRALVGFDVRTIPHKTLSIEQQVALRRSNIAADLAINPDVRDAGFTLPTFKHQDGTESKGCWPKDKGWAEGLLHEEYYRMLEEDAETQKQLMEEVMAAMQAQCQGQGQSGGQGEGDGPRAGGMVGHGCCGSGGGAPHPDEPKHDNPAGRTPSEMEQARRNTAEAVQQAAQKGRGSVPGGLLRWAGELTKPSKVPWQQQLQRVVRHGVANKAGAVDLRYNGMSRRQAAVGYGPGAPMLPRFRAPKPEVLFAIDTSGSMSATDLENAIVEVNAVIKTLGTEVEYCSIDAALQTVGKARSWKDIKLKGGGGTVFTEFFEMLAARRERPSVVIFATDGDAWGVPKTQPHTDVRFIWLLTGANYKPPVDWGVAINIDND